jgi:general stress protein 26
MNTFPQIDLDSLDTNDRTQIIGLVRRLLKANNPGVLSTVDQSGFPQSRWMATMSFEDFPNVYTLTAALRDAESMQRIWRQIADKSRAYFLNASGDGSGFAIIHTKVEMVECCIPKRSLRLLIDPQELFAAGP